MKTILAAYAAAAAAMLALDAVWLSVSADLLYRPLLGDILLQDFRPGPAILFYVLYVAGVVIFAIRPALVTGRWSSAAGTGALFGFFCYATYDLTNQATLKNWSTTLTIADLLWGTFVSAAAAIIGALANRGWTKNPLKLALAFATGSVAIYALGVAGLMITLGLTLEQALAGGVYPFLIGDLVKAIAAAALVPLAWKLLK